MGHGLGPPAHRHPLAIENFLVLDGVVVVHIDGESVRAEPGTFVHIPRMKPHTFTVETAETRVLNFYTPAGSELHVMSLARPAEQRRRPTMAEGPPPENQQFNETVSRLYGSDPVTALPFAVPPSEALLATPADAWAVGDTHLATPAEAPAFEAFGGACWPAATTPKANTTCSTYSPPRASGMPSRVLGADEAIYVLDGTVTVEADGRSAQAGVGSFAYAPAGSLFSWAPTLGPPAPWCFTCPVGSIARWLTAAAPTRWYRPGTKPAEPATYSTSRCPRPTSPEHPMRTRSRPDFQDDHLDATTKHPADNPPCPRC